MYRFVLCVLAGVFLLAFAGCEDEPSTPFPLSSTQSSAGSPPPGGGCADLDFESFDEAIDGGHYAFAYGTITSTEPVLALSDWNPAIEEGRTTCKGDVDPALRITVELSHATWDTNGEKNLLIGTNGGGWRSSKASPHVNADSSAISWSDGHKYFRKSDKIGALGAFSEHGHFLVGTTNFFTVDSDGHIANFHQSKCLAGELNRMSLDDVIERSHQATDGQKIYLTPTPTAPLSSACTE